MKYRAKVRILPTKEDRQYCGTPGIVPAMTKFEGKEIELVYLDDKDLFRSYSDEDGRGFLWRREWLEFAEGQDTPELPPVMAGRKSARVLELPDSGHALYPGINPKMLKLVGEVITVQRNEGEDYWESRHLDGETFLWRHEWLEFLDEEPKPATKKPAPRKSRKPSAAQTIFILDGKIITDISGLPDGTRVYQYRLVRDGKIQTRKVVE